MRRGWMLAGLLRNPGPVLGTLVACVVTAALTVAALMAGTESHHPRQAAWPVPTSW
jgi:hypothetical protein